MNLLDDDSFAFDEPDGDELLNLVADVYYSVDAIRLLLSQADLRPAAVMLVGTALDMWASALEVAAKSKGLRRLADVIYQDVQSVPLRPLLDRLKQSGHGGNRLDAYSLGMLPPYRAFINRVVLRSNLMELTSEGGARVLVIRGGPGLGKSHSWHLINHVAGKTKRFDAYRFDLSDWTGGRLGPRDVMTEICLMLGWTDPVVDSAAQPDTVVRLLISAFMGLSRGRDRRTCLVFDGYTERTTDDWARRLVIGIADAANAGEAGDLRVVLLEVVAPLTDELARDALPEDLGLGTKDDLCRFFDAAAAAVGQRVDEPQMIDLLRHVLGEPPYETEFPLYEIGPRAAQVARTSFPGPR